MGSEQIEKQEENMDDYWDLVIEPRSSLFQIDLKEIWKFRDLLRMFVKREIVQFYKQTILGPLWFFIQPLLTTIVFVIVFGKIAKITPAGKNEFLFYLSGVVLWNYFADVLNNTAATFRENAQLFGKVYFPRIIAPAAKAISNLLKLLIQLGLFFTIYFYLVIVGKIEFSISWTIFLLPILVLILFNLGMGLGMIVTSMTAKYKDLIFLITFGVQLLMYATPVIYSLQTIEGTRYYPFIAYNPLSPVIEIFRNSLLGGNIDFAMLGYSLVSSLVVFMLGLLIFNKTEKTFIDTV
ncbi:MAG: ABC transporter permease [Chitinophagales bacterium]|jgi:lipopolysaccharide transport system permease protein|nr:ABC transporter permease [Sphingobacteriales bacterium]